jgi:formylglycine-generating enzyme required for sulfatase activity
MRSSIQYAFILFLSVCLASGCKNNSPTGETATAIKEPPAGMVWIEGGIYTRGAVQPGEYPREYPSHKVEVPGFFIDTIEVTNAQYSEFVAATGYITIAERPVDWDEMLKQVPPGTPKPPDSLLVPGSLVFSPPAEIVSLDNYFQWWSWKNYVSWKHPEGPGSDISERMNHPVVHIAYADAEAYCTWKGGRLPTEAEWEYAARGGLEGKRFSWGDEDPLKNPGLANIYQGAFPTDNTAEDGFGGTAPVGSFPPNNYGLYDMAGNVWEWCSDLFNENYYYTIDAAQLCRNPAGPQTSYDPRDPYSQKRVMKGGSYLCHVSYCENYRPSAREAGAEDTGMPHLGFRCVIDSGL